MKLELRPALPADCERIWRWNDDPGVRAVSLSREPIPRASHDEWYARAIADPERTILVILAGGEEAGVLRFQRKRDDQQRAFALVSVVVDAAFRGRGIASQAIAQGCASVDLAAPVGFFEAWISEGNAASVASFQKARFSKAGENTLEDGRRFGIYRFNPRA